MIRAYYNNTLAEGCDLALKHRLYVSGWSLSGDYVYYRGVSENLDDISGVTLWLYFKDDVPIASLLVTESCRASCFVRKVFRRQGIATELLKEAFSRYNTQFKADYGVVGSDVFWKAFGGRVKFRG